MSHKLDDYIQRYIELRQLRDLPEGELEVRILEPDLKNGPGGMRDLCVGRWAAAARRPSTAATRWAASGCTKRPAAGWSQPSVRHIKTTHVFLRFSATAVASHPLPHTE